METEKMDSQEGKDNKKKIVTVPPLNSSHGASQNTCCWGAVAWRPEKEHLVLVILQIAILHIECHQHLYLLPAFFGMFLRHNRFQCTLGCPLGVSCLSS